jgi:hypothetical protein
LTFTPRFCILRKENFGLDKWAHYRIRNHWSIENSLHYVKDVTFDEDRSKITSGNSAESMSVIKNIAINILRHNNYKNLKQATRLLSVDIREIYKLYFK